MIRKLAKSIREYKKDTLLTPLFVSAEVVLEVIIPLLMAKIIDEGVYNGQLETVWKIGLALVFCALLSLTFGTLSGKFAAKASAGFAKRPAKVVILCDFRHFILEIFSIMPTKFPTI